MPVSKKYTADILWAAFFFLASTVITWWFINKGQQLYFSHHKMILSCTIAGSKWGIQILAALLLLQQKAWQFIRSIAFTCFAGSCILLPYCLLGNVFGNTFNFITSLVIAVLVMIAMYYRAVLKNGIGVQWFWGWMCCLAIAITLQLFVVFSVV